MAVLDSEILGQIQDILVEPNDGGATWPSGLWTTAEVVDYLNQRQRRFLQETQAVLTRSTQGIIPVTPRQPLPQSWIATRRIAFQPEGFDLFNGLISFWRLNEAAALPRADSIGPNTLLDNAAVGAAQGRVQGSANFVAASTQFLYITDPAQVGLNPGIADFSVSVWFYATNITGNTYFTVLAKDEEAFARGYAITILGSAWATVAHRNRIGIVFGDDVAVSYGLVMVLDEIITLNAWHHLAVTFDRDGNARAWLDGVEPPLVAGTSANMNAFANSQGNCTPPAPFALGAIVVSTLASARYFNGRIDACGYWNRLLLPAEISVLYNGGAGRELFPAVKVVTPTGTNFQALSPGDQFEMDNFIPSWATSPATRPTLYSDADPQTLEVVLLPPSVGNGTLHFLFVEQPTPLTGLGVPFSVPDEFVPTLKWGAIEDMLGKVGRAHDPIRARIAGEYFEFGVEAAKALMQGFAP